MKTNKQKSKQKKKKNPNRTVLHQKNKTTEEVPFQRCWSQAHHGECRSMRKGRQITSLQQINEKHNRANSPINCGKQKHKTKITCPGAMLTTFRGCSNRWKHWSPPCRDVVCFGWSLCWQLPALIGLVSCVRDSFVDRSGNCTVCIWCLYGGALAAVLVILYPLMWRVRRVGNFQV